MTITSKIAWDDTVLPFQLDHSDIRGRVVRLDGVLDQVLSQHNYPPLIEALVAEATLLTALIGQTIKLRWKLSLQIRGDGAVSMIATDYYGPTEDGQPARLRAYAGYDPEKLHAEGPTFAQIGQGFFAILIDQGEGMVPYQCITPLVGGSLSDCAGAYFAQSEQLPTRFALSFGKSQMPGQALHWRAGGVMLQTMPKASPFAAALEPVHPDGLLRADDILDGAEGENWRRANALLDTVEDLELIGPTVQPTELLVRLFHEEGARVFEAQPLRFGCSCSAQKVKESMATYHTNELADMVTDQGVITADCQFCGAHYEFTPDQLGHSFEGEDAP